MSNEITNADIYSVLLDLKGDMGEMKGTLVAQGKAFADHIVADAMMAKDIGKLQQSNARQRGFLTALGAVGTALGAGVGYAVDILARGGHH
jgi:hypothetical protein